MPITALVALCCLASPQNLKDEVTVKGLHLFARCWRTPTGETPYMIWTIGSRDPAPDGEEWVIQGDSISFEGQPIVPVQGFSQKLVAGDPDKVEGAMVEQPGGENATVAFIRGRVERVRTLVESLPLGSTALVKAAHKPQEDSGAIYHFQIDKPLKLTTPSGLAVEIPKQGAETKIRYVSLAFDPEAALTFKTNFKESEDKLPKSQLWQSFGGPVGIMVLLKGVGKPFAAGPVGGSFVAQSKGFDIKAGPVDGASLEITQSVVLESYPLDFRVTIKPSK
ncbi:MAG TPA: hypothetical protein VHE55_06920 [Fimbriimonadaceae bacterium]|nr:hypothetical protein [Fimbriimonadaceae bacterium]